MITNRQCDVVIIMAKKTKEAKDNKIMIGKKPTMNYVMAGLLIFEKSNTCILLARGNSISKLFNVSEILNRKFDNLKYQNINITTDIVEKDDKEYNVTSAEVELSLTK